MSKVITSCNNCIFNTNLNAYDERGCGHPLNEGQVFNSVGSYKEGFEFTSKSTGAVYRIYDHVTPKTCPLRKVKEIDIGCKIEVNLDEDLFEENFADSVGQSEQYFCCKTQINQRCSEQCLGCFQFVNKD